MFSAGPWKSANILTLFSAIFPTRSQALILISFGFKLGTPHGLDMLFDARFLPNPHFVPELKKLTGLDKKVADYVLRNKTARTYLGKMQDFLDYLMPLYIKEGRPYLTVGIGCTGGNHRSPAIVERLRRYLKKHPVDLSVVHRDIC